MEYVVIGWGLIYFAFITYLLGGWRNTAIIFDQHIEPIKTWPTVSVVVPVRNEARTISNLLETLHQQDYARDKLQVIIVDDDSTDGTANIVRSHMPIWEGRLSLLKSGSGNSAIEVPSPKKRAILTAIAHSTAEVILTTDGDCSMDISWLRSMVGTLVGSDSVAVSGPVALTGNSFFQSLQAMEFGSLVVSGASTLGYGWATLCNGANLGYYRSAFEEIGGYSGVEHQPSGDDEFLWHKFAKKFPGQLVFAASSKALVTTAAAENWQAFQQQRLRWASKWNQYETKAYSLFAAGLGIWYLGTLLLIVLTLFGVISWPLLGVFLSNKLLADCLFLMPAYSRIGQKWRWLPFFLVGIGYPFYASYFALRTLFNRGYIWKGREY
jgi:cellulose synthase/poly-beta-1,6-N-acetylglucosamine synthase-like glycosyltransferase